VEVGILPLDALELVPVINAVLVPGAEDQPVFVIAIAFWLFDSQCTMPRIGAMPVPVAINTASCRGSRSVNKP
jgi:hypothetical protein